MAKWADCSCCWPQKPRIRKAIGWSFYGPEGLQEDPLPPFWYMEISGWPRGHFDTWEEALKAAEAYLAGETRY